MKWTDAESNPAFLEALNSPLPLPPAVDPETVKKAVPPGAAE